MRELTAICLLSANLVLTRRSKHDRLFDHLVGAQQDRGRYAVGPPRPKRQGPPVALRRPQCSVRLHAGSRRELTVATEAQPTNQPKLLVVEDDEMIRMLLADMLCEIGYTVAVEAASVDEALEATRKTDFDLAILDADLKGRSVLPVADALVARDVRFVFVTGGGNHDLLAYRDRQTLNKPFQIDALKRCCKSALEQGND
jgi:CheY-like chemotaxis protein